MQTYRQSRFYRSPDGQLVLLKRSASRGSYPYLQADPAWPILTTADRNRTLDDCSSLLQLPAEILELCIHAAFVLDWVHAERAYMEVEHRLPHVPISTLNNRCFDSNWELTSPTGRISHQSIYALMLTCRTLHDIAVRKLYYEVDLDQFCSASPPFFEINNWGLRQIRNLFYETMQRNPMLQPLVKVLTLRNEGLDSELVKMFLLSPHLQSLSLENGWDTQVEIQENYGPAEEGAAHFVELYLRGEELVDQHSPALRRLLSYPAHLQIFELYLDPPNRHSVDRNSWSYAHIPETLSSQCHHLERLRLSWIGCNMNQKFLKVDAFPKLHTLQLYVTSECLDAIACKNWLTPSLQTLILDLDHWHTRKRPQTREIDIQAVGPFAALAKKEKELRTGEIGLEEIGIEVFEECEEWMIPESARNCNWAGGHKCQAWMPLVYGSLLEIRANEFDEFWVGGDEEFTAQMIKKKAPHVVEEFERLHAGREKVESA